MALIKCTECGEEVSDSAKFCHKCGYKKRIAAEIEKKEHYTALEITLCRIAIIFLILGLVLGIWAAIAMKTANIDYVAKSIAKPLDYPMDEMPPFWLLGITVFGLFAFFATVTFSLGKIIGISGEK